MKYENYDDFAAANLFGLGNPNEKFAKYFVGESYLNAVTDDKTGVHMSNVTFAPGCRNNWHTHCAKSGGGQLLLCIAGEGWYQEEGRAAVSLTPGKVVFIPAYVKHWHGAKVDSWFSHLAMSVPGEETSTAWHEPVSDEEYEVLQSKQ